MADEQKGEPPPKQGAKEDVQALQVFNFAASEFGSPICTVLHALISIS